MMTPNKPIEKEAEPLADIENHHVTVAENEETTAAEMKQYSKKKSAILHTQMEKRLLEVFTASMRNGQL